MNKECLHCGLNELIYVMGMFWAKKHFVMTKCAACGTEAYYLEDE